MSSELQSISRKSNQRKKIASSYNIPKKAKILTELLGKPHHSSHCGGGGGLSGEYCVTNMGYEFKNKDIQVLSYIKSYDAKEKYQVTEIYIKPEGALKSIIHGFSEKVYHQQDKEIEIFREDHRWIDRIDSLYDLAIQNKRKIELIKYIEDSDEKIKELKKNFGLF